MERSREGQRERFLLKLELVRRAIASFIAVSITTSHWGLFYTSGDVKQLDGGGEWWALHCLLLALIYLFVQQEPGGGHRRVFIIARLGRSSVFLTSEFLLLLWRILLSAASFSGNICTN